MLLRCEPNQGHPPQRSFREVERCGRFLSGQRAGFGERFTSAAQVNFAKEKDARRPDDLSRFTRDLRKRRAQRLVARDQTVQRLPQRRDVQRTVELQRRRDIIDRQPRHHAVDDPESSLRRGKRPAVRRFDFRSWPAVKWPERLRGGRPRTPPRSGGERAHRQSYRPMRIEARKRATTCVAFQTVAAQLEKIILRAHAPRRPSTLWPRPAATAISLAASAAPNELRSLRLARRRIRRRQRTAIDLPIVREREGIERDEIRRRHHVVGHATLHVDAQVSPMLTGSPRQIK